MRWPLRYQILVPFAGVMLAVLVGVSLLNAYLAARKSSQQTVRQLREVARTLAEATFPLTDTVLAQTHGLSGAHFVLAGPDGRVIAASLPDVVIPSDAARGAASWEQLDLGRPIEVGAERYFHAVLVLPGRRGADEPPLLHILYPQQIWREAQWQAAYPPLLIGAAALGVVALLALAIAARLSRPIVAIALAGGTHRPAAISSRYRCPRATTNCATWSARSTRWPASSMKCSASSSARNGWRCWAN